MFKFLIRLGLFLFATTVVFSPVSLNADRHVPNMTFSFLPQFVHYQGQVTVNGKPLSELKTGIDFIDVKFINPKQLVTVDGKQVELDEGQFEFISYYGDPIEGKYHIDVGPGVPDKTKFDIYVAGVKSNESIIFDPNPQGGCPVPNCFNRTYDLTINTLPTPTPTPVPPTPTPMPTVNPSFYSGQIIIGSSPVPDGVDVFAKINDYISEIVQTVDGKYTLTINPKTINYVDQNILLVIQGNESMTSIPFSPDQFINDANFLFQDFEIVNSSQEVENEPVPTPEPEKIIIVATPTPSIDVKSNTLASQESITIENQDSGGCSGGGSSKISIFSILTSIMLILLFRKSKKLRNSAV